MFHRMSFTGWEELSASVSPVRFPAAYSVRIKNTCLPVPPEPEGRCRSPSPQSIPPSAELPPAVLTENARPMRHSIEII